MASKLRIAVWYNLPSGGAKRALNDHLRGLKELGHEIVAWRPPLMQEGYLPVSEIVEERVVPLNIETGESRGYRDNVRRHFQRQLFLRRAMRDHATQAANEIDAGRFDILFTNTCMHYHAPWVGRFSKLPKLLYLQEPNRHLYEAKTPWPRPTHGSGLGGLKSRLKDFVDIRAYRVQAADELQNAGTYDRILCNSNYSRESILRAYGLPAEVCYLGIDTDHFQNQDLSREPFVLSIGAFVPYKDPEFIVRSMAKMTAKVPLVWVANIVDEHYAAHVKGLAAEQGVDLQIKQFIPDSELLELCNRASVLAYAPRLEPFGYAPLEANACGCPAVVVAEGGVKESIRDSVNGIVVPHREEAMAAALDSLLSAPDRARELGERASNHVREHWTLERATAELERNLLEVAQKR